MSCLLFVGGKFDFSALETDLTPFVGDVIKVKIHSEINPLLAAEARGRCPCIAEDSFSIPTKQGLLLPLQHSADHIHKGPHGAFYLLTVIQRHLLAICYKLP